MPVDQAPSGQPAAATEPAPASRRLIRTALKASLATLDRVTGHPYASLILVATEPDGAPVFLISRLALHTRNLEKDPRASLLIDGTGDLGDPLTGGRLTLMGAARPSDSPTARRRFLARHPSAEGYAGFADFSIYALEVASGHYIGGFGRIVDLAPAALMTGHGRCRRADRSRAGHRRAYEQRSQRCGRALCNRAGPMPGGGLAHVRHRPRRLRFAASHKHSAHRLSQAGALTRRGAGNAGGVGAAGEGAAASSRLSW